MLYLPVQVNFNLSYEAIKLAKSPASGPGPSAFEPLQVPPFSALSAVAEYCCIELDNCF